MALENWFSDWEPLQNTRIVHKKWWPSKMTASVEWNRPYLAQRIYASHFISSCLKENFFANFLKMNVLFFRFFCHIIFVQNTITLNDTNIYKKLALFRLSIYIYPDYTLCFIKNRYFFQSLFFSANEAAKLSKPQFFLSYF